MLIYFQKELPQNSVLDGKGRKIPFEVIDDSNGLAAFSMDDPIEFDYIEALRSLSSRRKGGVIELTEEQFLEVKKKLKLQPFQKPPKPSGVRALRPLSPYHPRQNAAAAVAAEPSEAKSKVDEVREKIAKRQEAVSAAAPETPKEEATSSVETESAPWDAAESGPRTATIKTDGEPADILANEDSPSGEDMAGG